MSVVIAIAFVIQGEDSFGYIVEVKNLMLNMLPNLLGFTLAGYTLIVGFVQETMTSKITEPLEDEKYSTYQKTSGTFAVNILFQIVALFGASLYHLYILLVSKNIVTFKVSANTLIWLNAFFLGLILFLFFISLFIIYKIVLNVFDFSQLHHYFIGKSKIDAVNAKPADTGSKRQNNS